MMHRTALLMSHVACAALAAANKDHGHTERTPPASGAVDPASTNLGDVPAGTAPVTPPHTEQSQVGESQLSPIATAPTPTGPAKDVEEARPLAGDFEAKHVQILADVTAELRRIAADAVDHDTTIRLNALADKTDNDVANAQAPTV